MVRFRRVRFELGLEPSPNSFPGEGRLLNIEK